MITTVSTRDQKNAGWAARLGSALRTTLACTIVGCTTLYGPAPIRHLLAYPAFSYVTTILIVSDATLGDSLRGCWHALYATIQVMIPSVLCLWLIGPARFNSGLAAVAVAITAFFIALPESTPLMAKRIAFGQTVIVYVGTAIHGKDTQVVMHPVHVATSTALGALASVLAMLVPFPGLAYYEVRKSCRLYIENALERLDLYTEAFTTQDNHKATDLISRAKFLSRSGIRYLQSVEDGQRGMIWEKLHTGLVVQKCKDPGENLREVELSIRGMEIALTSCHFFPIGAADEEFKDQLLNMKGKIGLKLEQAKCFAFFDSTTAPEVPGEIPNNTPWIPKTKGGTHEYLAAFFFLYCMELLQQDTPIDLSPECVVENKQKITTEDIRDHKECGFFRLLKTWNQPMIKLSRENWTFAIKCSLSLGFGVLFGLTFNKENGYWSGITIAISILIGRQPIITAANARAQGTAIGSVYGILCCSIFRQPAEFRFLPLLPWIMFTSFLRHSRMYGQAGGISAVIGALFILGRKNYGLPSEFAIARLSEVCIGLLCLILMEIILQPARAASLAKTEVAWSLEALHDCIEDLVLYASEISMATSIPLDLRRKQKKLKYHVDEMEKFIAEAEVEPNFWFMPFHGACYAKFLRSMRNMEDLLVFAAHEIQTLSQVSEKMGVDWKALQEQVNDDLDVFEEKTASSLRFIPQMLLINSLAELDKELKKKNISRDIELGSSLDGDGFRNLVPNEEEVLELESSFLQHSLEVANTVNVHQGMQNIKSQMILCLSGLGFCIGNIMRETAEIQKEVRELITWENPTKLINLREIYCKLNCLSTK